MPQLRAEQLKNSTLTDLQIALNASIKQSKIAGQTDDPTGWISKGTVHVVETDPTWDGSQEGQLYYINTTDELKIGVGFDPYFVMINNNGEPNSKWDSYILVKNGNEASDWDNTAKTASTFVCDHEFSTDGSDMFLYLNGILLQLGQDYTILNTTTIKLNGTITSLDKITFVVYVNTTLSNYATKAYVENKFLKMTSDIIPDMTGSSTNVSLRNIGSSTARFNTIWANDVHVGANSLYVNGKKVISDETSAMTFTCETDNNLSISTSGTGVVNLVSDSKIQAKGNFLPEMTGATGHFSVRTIGNDGNRFSGIYSKDAYLDTLLINDKQLISEVSAIPTISSDNVTVKATTGMVKLSAPTVQLEANMLPEMTGATGTISARTLGDPTHRFAHVYADEVHVGASSLYVNGKQVISDVSETMTFSTEVDKSMNIKTTGVGSIAILSNNMINATAAGGLEWKVPATSPSKNINFTNQSADGNIIFNSASQIQFTAPTVSTGNLTITGNLTVNGTTTTVNTEQVGIKDNLITINSNQTGTPPDTLISGIDVERGDENNYRFIFEESTDTFKIGMVGSLQAVATRDDSPVANTIPYWNAANVKYSSSSVTVSGSTITGNLVGNVTGIASNATNADIAATANKVCNVSFHADTTAPTGTTQLNCEGYLYATKVYNAVWNDLAEFMYKDGDSEAGDVLIQTSNGAIKSNVRAAKSVIGVYSDTFGYALGAEAQNEKVPVGISGRVKVKVREPLAIGDLLVSDVDGFASKATPEEETKAGIILGKVVEEKSDSSVSRIWMLIMNR